MSEVGSILKTLNSYAESGAGDHALTGMAFEIGRDRRFTSLLIFSLIAHGIFVVGILRIDWVLFHRAVTTPRSQAPLVKLTELAAPPDRFPLRTKPEPIERADISRLQFDPNDPDDQRLLSRSPRPSQQRGNAGRLPSSDQLERRLRATRGGGEVNETLEPTNATVRQPPTTAQVQPGPNPPTETAPFADGPPGRSSTASPAPAPAPPATAKTASEAAPGSRRGTGSESSALGMSSAQGLYIAYVRAKILHVNETNLPRKWIEDVLHDKVSAQFGLTIRRDGRVGSLELVRSSGYAVLDGRAREAIILASPFEGYPQNAGDSLQFTVTVYYTPYR